MCKEKKFNMTAEGQRDTGDDTVEEEEDEGNLVHLFLLRETEQAPLSFFPFITLSKSDCVCACV